MLDHFVFLFLKYFQVDHLLLKYFCTQFPTPDLLFYYMSCRGFRALDFIVSEPMR